MTATSENLTKKKPGKDDIDTTAKKGRFWFDGFEFVPIYVDEHGVEKNQYMMAWQNCEGLSEKADVGGYVYFYDLKAESEKPKF